MTRRWITRSSVVRWFTRGSDRIARLGAIRSRRLAPILGVAAVDLFLEEISGSGVKPRRPKSWNKLVEQMTGKRLSDIVTDFDDLKAAVGVRNALAHAGNHRAPLPRQWQQREATWEIRRPARFESPSMPPSSEFALSQFLEVVLAVRRQLRQDVRTLGTSGLVAP